MMKKAVFGLIAAMMIAAAGCGGQTPVAYTELAARLGTLKGDAGSTAGKPYTVKIVPVNIAAVWGDINDAVNTAGKYVILDLSACSASGNEIVGNENYNEDPSGNDFNIIKDNEYLTGIILPDSLTAIGEYAFYRCKYLTNITIGSGVTGVNFTYLSGCTNLSAITVKPANSAFSSVDGVLFNKDKTTLIRYPQGKGSVYSIPNSVTEIGAYAFFGSQLTSVTIPNSVTEIGVWAFGGNQLTSVTIPDSVTTIEHMAFSSNQLTSVTIPNSVTEIGLGAFYYNPLTSVTIPASRDIGRDAFPGNFVTVYIQEGSRAGTYVSGDGGKTWRRQ
ncbi:MAG: leucine-rich repeat domain-containing protein [Spirochaetaceae bacterium]|jgi:hypothetical protein|nr:leucine-rich repeat domain-containing protein [Spirochaetaceae bacterium]